MKNKRISLFGLYSSILLACTKVQAQDLGTLKPADYQYSMNITATYFDNCEYPAEIKDTLAAFVGEEFRGKVAFSEVIDNKDLAYLTVFSNLSTGEEISFKIKSGTTGDITTLLTTVDFAEGKVLGGRTSPFTLYSDDELILPTIEISKDSIYLLKNYSNYSSYRWFFVSQEEALAEETDSILIAEIKGFYFVEVTSEDACVMNSNKVEYSPLGISKKTKKIGMELYPNPSKGFLTLDTKAIQEKLEEIYVLDVSGKRQEILDYQIQNESIHLDLSGLEKGVYWINVNFDTSTLVQKVVLIP